MNEMIERVAEAIYEHMPYKGRAGTSKPAWSPSGNSLKQYEARLYARAAIAAMRQPTEAVDMAGGERIAAAAPLLLEALEMVMQHGRIDDSEARMNQVAAALAAAKGE